ncbi:MAG: hypothetical protein IKL32_03720 [Alphaproteobacteria bacterium]|nr:hypothetical protein [Alphaproteobacteria bacterium]
MPSTNYDPRYPFGKPAKKTEQSKMASQPEPKVEEQTQTTAEEKIPQPKTTAKEKTPQSEKSAKEKRSKLIRNTLIGMVVLAAAGYIYGEYQEHQERQEYKAFQEKRDFLPNKTQENEPILHCPVYKQGAIGATLEEREAYAHVIGGLDAHERFPEELRRAVVREVLIGLESGMGKADALARAEQALFQGIAQDANTNIFKKNNVGHQVAYGLSRLQTNFPTPVAVQTRDVPRILKAIPFCLETVQANLDSYSADEAQTMLETFGTMMVRPDLGREVTQYVAKNQEWAIEAQKKVLRETARGIQGGFTPHEATCRAVSAVFNDTQTPIAFYAQAQTAKLLQGKTHSQMLGALGANLEQLKEYPQGWIGQNASWLSARTPAPTPNTQGSR